MLSRSAARPRPATTPNRSRQPHASQLLAPQPDSRGTRLTHIADLLASSAVPCLVRARSGATKGMARRSVRARSANTLGPRGHRTRVAPARVPGRPFTRPPTAFMLRRCKPFPRDPNRVSRHGSDRSGSTPDHPGWARRGTPRGRRGRNICQQCLRRTFSASSTNVTPLPAGQLDRPAGPRSRIARMGVAQDRGESADTHGRLPQARF